MRGQRCRIRGGRWGFAPGIGGICCHAAASAAAVSTAALSSSVVSGMRLDWGWSTGPLGDGAPSRQLVPRCDLPSREEGTPNHGHNAYGPSGLQGGLTGESGRTQGPNSPNRGSSRRGFGDRGGACNRLRFFSGWPNLYRAAQTKHQTCARNCLIAKQRSVQGHAGAAPQARSAKIWNI